MSNIEVARASLAARILTGTGHASAEDRQTAFNNCGLAAPPVAALVDKVASRAYSITNEDIHAALVSGLSEDQLFEIVVCAAVGQATRQYDMGMAALDSATERE